jgi:hypothetical protein
MQAIPFYKRRFFFFLEKKGCILGTQGMDTFNIYIFNIVCIDADLPLLQAMGLFQLTAKKEALVLYDNENFKYR